MPRVRGAAGRALGLAPRTVLATGHVRRLAQLGHRAGASGHPGMFTGSVLRERCFGERVALAGRGVALVRELSAPARLTELGGRRICPAARRAR